MWPEGWRDYHWQQNVKTRTTWSEGRRNYHWQQSVKTRSNTTWSEGQRNYHWQGSVKTRSNTCVYIYTYAVTEKQSTDQKCHHITFMSEDLSNEFKACKAEVPLHGMQVGDLVSWQNMQTMSTPYTACRLEVLSFDDNMCRPWVHPTQPADWKCYHLMTICVDHEYTLHSLQTGSAIIWWQYV